MIEKTMTLQIPPGVRQTGTRHESRGRWYDSHLVRWVDGVVSPVGGWRGLEDWNNHAITDLIGAPRRIFTWRHVYDEPTTVIGTHNRLYVIDLVNGVVDITPADGLGTVLQHALVGANDDTVSSTEAATWHLDSLGANLVGALYGNYGLYVWDGNLANRAVLASGSENCVGVVVTPERFVVALAPVTLGGGSIKWASQGTTDTWTAASTNTAGDLDLQTSGRLRCGRRFRNQTLLWTDVDLWSLNYVGGELVYGAQKEGDNCGIIAPNAVAIGDNRAFWMGESNFFVYDGYVRSLPCDVHDFVFKSMKRRQRSKIWAMTNASFNEVWWFFPRTATEDRAEPDAYVVYNYRDNHWHVGYLDRSAGADREGTNYPIMGSVASYAAVGQLNSTGVNVADGATVTIGSKTYTFQTTLTNADGNVHIGTNAAGSLANLFAAINLEAGAGTDYATAMTIHPTVTATALQATLLQVTAKAGGTGGNSIATTETSTQLSWGGATLSGGGSQINGCAISAYHEHEYGSDRSGSATAAYLQSAPIALGDGDQVMRIHRYIPDENTLGDTRLTVNVSMTPTGSLTSSGPFTAAAETDLRLTGRYAQLTLAQANAADWRLGALRFGVLPGSRR